MKLLNKEEVCARLNISPRCLENWVGQGRFPPPVRIGKFNHWCESALDRWTQLTFNTQQNWTPSKHQLR